MQHLDEFKDKASEVIWHIPSKFNKEMSMKSEVVSHLHIGTSVFAPGREVLVS